jgi:hypothetical protein
MACPIILVNDFINNYKKENTDENIDIDNFKKLLYNNYSIMTKYDEESKLMLVYHKYELPTKSKLEEDCRSLVIDIETLQIISYTCQNPVINKEAQQFLLNNNNLELDIYKCYEGTIMSVFYHKDKWYCSTRRCLDSNKSKWGDTNYYDMFMEVLSKDNITFEEFGNKLNKEYGYHFILIHHKNNNVIDYSKQFGENYKKLCLVFVRNKSDQSEVNNYDFNFTDNIFRPDKMTMEEFSIQNKDLNIDLDMEGIIIKTNTTLIKLQTISYQFCKTIGPESNIFKGYLYLYQNGTLKNYVENKNVDKIINPNNSNELFDIIGIVDCVFKVLTSELFELYKLLWKFKNNEKQNNKLYTMLPKEFKDILYGLRGVFFKIKVEREIKIFGIKDIYNYLKSIHIEQLCALLRQRKLMFNWVISNKTDTNLQLFKTISNVCDKVHLKLMAIFINKIFPDITSKDIPKIVDN